jgi:hypothetical protein
MIAAGDQHRNATVTRKSAINPIAPELCTVVSVYLAGMYTGAQL